MAYTKLIYNIATAVESHFKEISARYNFDYGDEFEIAICELLIRILPDQYGVCRGFVVTERDEYAGDDVIVYDKNRFPTLRLLDKSKFDKKQEIPVEAVYAYLEAKHTMILHEPDSGQSFFKSFDQVSKVKKLQRESRDAMSIDPYTNLGSIFTATRNYWPNLMNPIYGAIISRYVKDKTKSEYLPSDKMFEAIKAASVPKDIFHPDLVILGQSDLMFPSISSDKTICYESPFFIEESSTLIHKTTKNSSLAIGVIMLLYALDTIKLGKMPYQRIIMKQLL
jgi:hypothetical protein